MKTPTGGDRSGRKHRAARGLSELFPLLPILLTVIAGITTAPKKAGVQSSCVEADKERPKRNRDGSVDANQRKKATRGDDEDGPNAGVTSPSEVAAESVREPDTPATVRLDGVVSESPKKSKDEARAEVTGREAAAPALLEEVAAAAAAAAPEAVQDDVGEAEQANALVGVVEQAAPMAPSDKYRAGQAVLLKKTLYSSKSGVVYARLLRAYEHAEMYFVEAPGGAAMVTTTDQMTLRPEREALSDKAIVVAIPPDDIRRIVDCGEDYKCGRRVVARYVTPLERVTIGEYAPYILGLQSSEPHPNTDQFDFEDLRLFMEDGIEELRSAAPMLAKGTRVLVRHPGDPKHNWIHEVLWHATVKSVEDETVTVQYSKDAAAKYSLETVVQKENVVPL